MSGRSIEVSSARPLPHPRQSPEVKTVVTHPSCPRKLHGLQIIYNTSKQHGLLPFTSAKSAIKSLFWLIRFNPYPKPCLT